MKAGVLLLSFIICGLGSTLAFVFFNPIGLVIDSLGFMLFLYAIFSKEEQNFSQIDRSMRRIFDKGKQKEIVLS